MGLGSAIGGGVGYVIGFLVGGPAVAILGGIAGRLIGRAVDSDSSGHVDDSNNTDPGAHDGHQVDDGSSLDWGFFG